MTIEVWMLIATGGVPLIALGIPAVVTWGNTRARLDRLEKDVVNLEEKKASRESHDGLKDGIAQLRSDMDKRFDRLERILGREATSPGD